LAPCFGNRPWIVADGLRNQVIRDLVQHRAQTGKVLTARLNGGGAWSRSSPQILQDAGGEPNVQRKSDKYLLANLLKD
jgi:hypothetical protein